jgi:quercetin dioxygenase-like cupin family protein
MSANTKIARAEKRFLWGALLPGLLAGPLSFAQNTPPNPPKERARVVLSTPLPTLDGNHLKSTLVEVNYGPGEASPPHSHPCAVVGYVVEGALRTQVEGEPEHVYEAGSSFYEAPNGVHAVSANASATRPAKLVAYFVCDRETPLSVDVAAHAHSKGN